MFKVIPPFLVLFLILISCKKETPVSNEQKEKSDFTHVWSKMVSPSAEFTFVGQPVLAGDIFIYSQYSEGDLTASMYFVDAKNGKQLGIWNDYYQSTSAGANQIVNVSDGIAIVNSYSQRCFYAIDLNTFKTIWKRCEPSFTYSGYFKILNGYMYVAGNEIYSSDSARAVLLRSPITHPDFEIIEIAKSKGMLNYITNLSVLDEDGATMAYFRMPARNVTNLSLSKMSLVKFNVNDKKVLWQTDSIEHSYHRSVGGSELHIDDKYVFLSGYLKIVKCLRQTGEIIWEHNYTPVDNSYLFNTDIHRFKDLLIYKPYSEEVIAINTSSGNINWVIPDLGFPNYIDVTNTRLKDHLILPLNGQLIVLNTITGKRKTLDFSENFPKCKVVVDEIRNYLYWQDNYKVYCYHVDI